MHRCGIIDLGSNTIRLVVYEVKKSPGERLTKKDFSTLISTKKTVGLSNYVIDGQLSDAGIERAAEVLSDMIGRAKVVNCDSVSIFATAVLRNCNNSKAAVKAIEKRIGCRIDMISGEKEARLDFVGASCDRKISSGTLIDIGGGSTELVQIAGGKAGNVESISMGSVSTYASFVRHVLPTPAEIDAIAKALSERLDRLNNAKSYRCSTLYGVGGSIRALGKLDALLLGQEKKSRELDRGDIARLTEALRGTSSDFTHALTKAAPDRIHTIGCGLVILSTVMDTLGAKRIEICKYGVREGYLLECVRAS